MKAFDWGESSDWYKNTVNQEIFVDKIYERIFPVEADDMVLDLGASIGPFAYSILDKDPLYIVCLEPSVELFELLKKNVESKYVICINSGISDINGTSSFDKIYGFGPDKAGYADGITFDSLVKCYFNTGIDFLKTDCEGGEYDMFTEQNRDWIKDNVKKIAGEWHLSTPELKQKFRQFRDMFMGNIFTKFCVHSVNGVDITWDLHNEHFLEYYNEVIIYIDNR